MCVLHRGKPSCNADGTGSVKYKDALAAIFIEGWIFIILSLTGARQFLIKLLPRTLALSMSAGRGRPVTHETKPL